MGCANSFLSVKSDAKIQKTNEKRTKGLFYATKEFDLTESENEDEILSIKPAYYKEINTRETKSNETLSASPSITRPPPIIRHSLLDNRLEQTGV